MPRKETLGAALAAILIVAAVVAGFGGYLAREEVGTIVGALTALVIVWYTVETSRIRRDAEARTIRDTQAVVRFEVVNPELRIPQVLAHGATPEDGVYHLRFWLKNESGNAGIGRVRIRLALHDRVVLAGEDAYDGTRYWEIAPYFQLGGIFDLCALINAALDDKEKRWPADEMTLAAQVELYDAITRKLIWSASKEYFLKHREGTFEFWPHVSAQVMASLPALDRLPTRTKGSRP